ncbi:MAG: aminotransferase class I/II-fold pyridoxal phosphate-dependent enzyme [Bacteroidales bacterium]|nr:aminotransferase class I/II-fold pyridoxal phosphate-dependent enzyme [Clostridium sp.]MCM1204335.1 aminotransferase class I/II-fold pyridoxal phosphate-dependent enzyme [Bacteroidales bacterium]
MAIVQESFHGSDLEQIAKQYHMDKDSIIPYASNVNPLGFSPMARQALLDNIDAIQAYPDRDYVSLRTSISNYCGASPEQLVLGNGTSSLIRLTLETLSPKKTMIIGPTYSEYERAARLAGSEVDIYMLKNLDDFELDVDLFLKGLNDSIDLLIICNPNNPTSKVLTREQINTILARCLQLNIFVMIDETYVEFVKDVQLISSVILTKKYDNLIVLRSVSKFFAAPGIRLGYAVTSNEDFLEATANGKIPWNINTYASVAGVMFEDERYINLTKSLIQTERNLIFSALSSRKTIKVFKPEANFVLFKLLKEEQTATEVFEYCIQKGFMIRDCTDYAGLGEKYVRFCFLKPEQNDNMVNTILEIV